MAFAILSIVLLYGLPDRAPLSIREMVALKERVAKLEGRRTSLLDLDSTADKISLGGLGGGMLLAGTLALAGWRKRKQNEA